MILVVVLLGWMLLIAVAWAVSRYVSDFNLNKITMPLLLWTALATLLAVISGLVVGEAIV